MFLKVLPVFYNHVIKQKSLTAKKKPKSLEKIWIVLKNLKSDREPVF
jgi:hypothetical protein